MNPIPALRKGAVKKEVVDHFKIACLTHHTEVIIMHIDMSPC
jgi:hypothetical protein